MSPVAELAPADLRRVCDVSRFSFETTADLPFTRKIVGQPRGTRSIEFGIEIASPGFNIYVMGPVGTGRTTTIERFLQEKAAAGPVPGDLVFVQNFRDLRRPRAICLPPGTGTRFRDDLAELVDSLKREIPKAFETEEYKDALSGAVQELEAKRNRILQKVRHQAAERGFAIVRTPDGLIVAPVVDGQPMQMEAYEALTPEKREELDAARRVLERDLNDALRTVQEVEQSARDEIATLGRRVAASVVGGFIEPLQDRYAGEEEALLHLNLVRDDVVAHVSGFLPDEEAQPEHVAREKEDLFHRYSVNLIVDHRQTTGSPVIVESNPTYHNLVGRIEYDVKFGVPTTDFMNIKAGALHRANGGYLVLRAGDLLSHSHAWSALKRALNSGEIRIEEPAAESVATKTVEPEPIPLNVKIILMGSLALYYSLLDIDEDFSKLFKVRADFDAEMDRTPENEDEFALFIATRCHEEGLRHFDKSAVGRIIEQGSRLAEAQDRLTTRFGEVANIVREASYWAGDTGREFVSAPDVVRAVQERTFRSNLLETKLRRHVQQGILLVDTSGSVVGQVNGLYTIQVGDYGFGQPSRITAQTYMGSAGVVSIEREVKLAGPIHNRGVLTLIGYLGGTYAQGQPLSLSASLAFEQNYSGVEGDSASSAELYALLSSLSALPINQGIAVTGSVNQWGQVQPIGGAIAKIEGFFETCSRRGLTGEQGVIIPAANVRDLMLRQELCDAVAAGQFHIWAVRTIDEGLTLLTGVLAGERGPDGVYPQGTVHGAVQKRLRQLAIDLEVFGKDEQEKRSEDTQPGR
jgi:lon-related putative ATP-dependent protease